MTRKPTDEKPRSSRYNEHGIISPRAHADRVFFCEEGGSKHRKPRRHYVYIDDDTLMHHDIEPAIDGASSGIKCPKQITVRVPLKYAERDDLIKALLHAKIPLAEVHKAQPASDPSIPELGFTRLSFVTDYHWNGEQIVHKIENILRHHRFHQDVEHSHEFKETDPHHDGKDCRAK